MDWQDLGEDWVDVGLQVGWVLGLGWVRIRLRLGCKWVGFRGWVGVVLGLGWGWD